MTETAKDQLTVRIQLSVFDWTLYNKQFSILILIIINKILNVI